MENKVNQEELVLFDVELYFTLGPSHAFFLGYLDKMLEKSQTYWVEVSLMEWKALLRWPAGEIIRVIHDLKDQGYIIRKKRGTSTWYSRRRDEDCKNY